VPEPAVTRRGRQAAETDCGQPAPAQPVAGAMASSIVAGTSASNAILWVFCLWRSGRPRQAPSVVCGRASLAHWLDTRGPLNPVVAQLTQAIETHKHTHLDDDFALLHHREQTLRHRFQALFLPPSLASNTSPSLIRASIRSPRCSVAAIKAPP